MSELKLYETPKIMEQLINDVDDDGVISPEALIKLDELEITIEEKAGGIWFLINRFSSFEETIDKEITRLQNLKKSYWTNTKSLKWYIKHIMQKLNRDKIETDLIKFSFRWSKSITIINEDDIPREYFKTSTKTTTSLDKNEITKLLKDWKKIPWVILEEHQNLQVK